MTADGADALHGPIDRVRESSGENLPSVADRLDNARADVLASPLSLLPHCQG